MTDALRTTRRSSIFVGIPTFPVESGASDAPLKLFSGATRAGADSTVAAKDMVHNCATLKTVLQ